MEQEQLLEKLRQIRLLCLDFDGVMTDNRVLVSEDGIESVFCNRGDGMGIELLKKHTNVEIIVLSKETNKVTAARCNKLKIDCVHGIENKAENLRRAMESRGLKSEEVCFIGNDVNDLGCLELAGVGIVVADSHAEIIAKAGYVTKAKGGWGAVREICDLIIKAKRQI